MLETSQHTLADWTMPGPVTSRLFLVFRSGDEPAEEGRPVAAAKLMVSPRDSPAHAYPHVVVDAPHRRRGIGSFVAAHLEGIARADGRTSLQAWVEHPTPGGERVPAPTGHGSVSAADPATRFLWKHGWELGQIERISELRLPVPVDVLLAESAAASARAGADYRVVTWEGESDAAYLDDLARLNGDMSVDALLASSRSTKSTGTPSGSCRWNAARSLPGRRSQRRRAAHPERPPRGPVDVAARPRRHDTTRPAQQDNTLVTEAHRGKRLGMLVKAANLMQLAERYPECTGVFT